MTCPARSGSRAQIASMIPGARTWTPAGGPTRARGGTGCGPSARQEGTAITDSAITVSCHPGENLMIHAVVEVCRPGDVLVVTTTSPSTDGMFGDLLATSLMARGVLGRARRRGPRHRVVAGDEVPGLVPCRACPGPTEPDRDRRRNPRGGTQLAYLTSTAAELNTKNLAGNKPSAFEIDVCAACEELAAQADLSPAGATPSEFTAAIEHGLEFSRRSTRPR